MTLVRRYWNKEALDASALSNEFEAYRGLLRSALHHTTPSVMQGFAWGKVNRIVTEVCKCANMSMVLTSSGRLGLVSHAAAEIGDACCIFSGATVPFILAPAPNGQYRLVGESYIDGVMDGELVNHHIAGTLVLE